MAALPNPQVCCNPTVVSAADVPFNGVLIACSASDSVPKRRLAMSCALSTSGVCPFGVSFWFVVAGKLKEALALYRKALKLMPATYINKLRVRINAVRQAIKLQHEASKAIDKADGAEDVDKAASAPFKGSKKRFNVKATVPSRVAAKRAMPKTATAPKTAAAPKARFAQVKPAKIPAAITQAATAAIVEAEPAAIVEAEPAAIVEAEPAAIVEAEPAAIVEAEPAAIVEAEPAAIVEAEPAAIVEAEPAEIVEAEPAAIVEAEPAAIVEAEPAAFQPMEAAVEADSGGSVSAPIPSPAPVPTPPPRRMSSATLKSMARRRLSASPLVKARAAAAAAAASSSSPAGTIAAASPASVPSTGDMLEDSFVALLNTADISGLIE
jgi:hypothetical protein